MNEREYLLLVDDDRNVTEGLGMLLERPGRTTIICSDVESAEITLARFPITHLVTDVQFSGMFGFEGLHFLGRIRTQMPQCRIVLITGHATEALRATAIENGAHALLAKPFEIAELETALATRNHDDGGDYAMIRVPSLDHVVASLDIAFQPIVQLKGDVGAPFAFEALARVGGDWPVGGADTLFDYAARRDRLTELNLAALRRAIEASGELPGDTSVFINVDPTAFMAGELMRVLTAASRRTSLPLSRVVLEITERSAFAHLDEVEPLFEELRAAGIRFALDDHGSAYSHLGIIDRLRPSFVKISQTFGTGLENDKTKQRIVGHVASLARDLGCRTILEGIESASTVDVANELGIDFVQGYHFGRPNPASHWRTRSFASANAA
jgi:EAL domain-containing protein (putative c-di-GMP-specific phosphodiesterase class I)